MVNNNKAVFLDRDGVLVKSFVKKGKAYAPIKFKDFKIYKDSEKCIKKLNFICLLYTLYPSNNFCKIELERELSNFLQYDKLTFID